MSKGFALIPLMIVIVVAALSGYGIYKYLLKNPPPPIVQDKMVPPTLPQETKPVNTYKNDTLGFEFTVPEGFSVKEEAEAEFHKRTNGDMRKNFTSYVKIAPPKFINSLYLLNSENNFESSPLSIWIFENPQNLTPDAFYKKYWYYPFVWGDFTQAKNKIAPNEKFMIGDKEASASAILETEPNPQFILLARDKMMYLFRIVNGESILKDFHFLN